MERIETQLGDIVLARSPTMSMTKFLQGRIVANWERLYLAMNDGIISFDDNGQRFFLPEQSTIGIFRVIPLISNFEYRQLYGFIDKVFTGKKWQKKWKSKYKTFASVINEAYTKIDRCLTSPEEIESLGLVAIDESKYTIRL
jgi:hypothetical protein